MDQKLRLRILRKLAQTTTQTTAPSTTAPPLGAPPAVPSPLTATLNVGYNADTIPPLTSLLDILNKTLHYASDGKGNMQKIQNNAYTADDAKEPAKSIGEVAKQAYQTFFNNGKAHTGAYDAKQIGIWVDTLLGSSAYNNLATINSGSPLASKIQQATGGGTIKDAIRKQLDLIKSKNPITT